MCSLAVSLGTEGPRSTLQAVQGAMGLVCPGGAVAVTVYRGHSGGAEEGQCLADFLRTVSLRHFTVMEGKYLNHEETAPYWVLIQRK
ncbi:MAG: hypothetical protein FWG14_08785 [Peptococcaceae bacterium]|nr:hypothetical protein [Peptococcaceae bacterium]